MLRIAVMICALATNAEAQIANAGYVYDTCRESPEAAPVQFAYCFGYIAGVWDGIEAGSYTMMRQTMPESSFIEIVAAGNAALGVCPATDTSKILMIDIFIQYMEVRSHERQKQARSMLLNAMQEAFPC